MTAHLPLINDLEDAFSHGSAERRAESIRRVTDLFVFGAEQYSDDQIALFDHVLGRLVEKIESSTRATLASRLATVANAPPNLVRTLARDDEIGVAGPLLSHSPQVDDAILIESAQTKSQHHLLAIARRGTLTEAITNVLVDRGDQNVVHATAENPGAQFSDVGYAKLVDRSIEDDKLASIVGSRNEIPRHHFLRLLAKASHTVRAKLEAADPYRKNEIQLAVAQVASRIQSKAVTKSKDYSAARTLVNSMHALGRLGESDILTFAMGGQFEETAAALAIRSNLPVEAVEQTLVQDRPEAILIVTRAIGLSWPTVKAILLLRAGERGMSKHDMERCLSSFTRLKLETAQQVLEFQRKRAQTKIEAAG